MRRSTYAAPINRAPPPYAAPLISVKMLMWRYFRGVAVKTFNRLGMAFVVAAAALSIGLITPTKADVIEYTLQGVIDVLVILSPVVLILILY